jgi:hypothetical protein
MYMNAEKRREKERERERERGYLWEFVFAHYDIMTKD